MHIYFRLTCSPAECICVFSYGSSRCTFARCAYVPGRGCIATRAAVDHRCVQSSRERVRAISHDGFLLAVPSPVREWKALNVISALLLSCVSSRFCAWSWSFTLRGRAILIVFKIQDAESDPLTRTAALCSLVSALMSLSFGVVYIVRFDNMHSMYRASRWAKVCTNSSLVNSH